MSPLTDAIEALVEEDPDGSRTAVYAYTGDEFMRLRAIGTAATPAAGNRTVRQLNRPTTLAELLPGKGSAVQQGTLASAT